MYETVKTVKGYAITRMVGTRGFYHVVLRNAGWIREERVFRTIKAAVQFIETSL